MDLYEALKDGTSADELVATFNKELEAAKAKLKEETEAEQVAQYRSELAEAVYNYISALSGFEIPSFTVADIEKELKDSEKELAPVFTLLSGFQSAKEEAHKLFKTESKTKTDDDILDQFIKILK